MHRMVAGEQLVAVVLAVGIGKVVAAVEQVEQQEELALVEQRPDQMDHTMEYHLLEVGLRTVVAEKDQKQQPVQTFQSYPV